MSKSFIYNSYVDADFDPIPKPSSSSSATLTASPSHHHHRQQQQQQPHQSSQSSTRQRLTQTERMKQLQDLDQHIQEATHWSRRRAEMVTTSTSSSRYRQSMDATRKTSSSNYLPSQRSSMETDMNDTGATNATDEDSSCLDLREASLEDLEGLIAASAQRLANYRLRRKSQQHQQLSVTNDTTTSPISASTTSSSCSLPSHGGADEKTHTGDASSSPPLPSVYTNKDNNKKSSLHRILPTSLSSQHYSLVVDKEKKFSLVSPTSPSLSSFRRSYQMTSPPVPVGATTSSSQLKKREQQRMKNQYSSSPPSPTAATTAIANKLSAGSSRLVSSVSSSSGLAALLDSTSTSSSSSASSPSSSTSSDHQITKSSSQQRSSLPSTSRRRLRTLSTLAQQSSTSSLESPCTSRSSIGLSLTSEKPTVRTTSTGPSIRQRTQSTTTQHSPQDTTTRKSLDSTTTRQQRTRHVSMLTKPSNLASPPVRSRKTSMVTTTTTPLLRKQPQDGATEDSTTTTTDTSDTYRRPRVISQTHSPNKPATARLRVSSTTTTAASNTVATPRSIRDTPAANKIGIKQSNKPTGRKRGKTLPGSLATPPPKPLTLPPIKVEPIHQQDNNPNMRPSAKTPTRIPLLKTSRSQNANTATDEDRDIDDDTEDDVNETIPSTKASVSNNQSSASYIAPPGMLATNTSKTTLRVDPILRKQHSSVTMRTSTSQVTSNSSNNSKQSGHHHYSNKSSTSLMDATSSHARTRKISTISTRTGLGVSASVKPAEKSSDPRRNRVPTLHERLQALVNESNSWRSSANSGHTKSTTTSTPLSTSSHKKEKIVIRGGGHSTTTSNTTASGDDTTIVFQGGQALTPQQGMKQGGYYLTDFEKIEMQQYPAIYFMGQPDCNKRNQQQQQQNKKSSTEWNDGYDDERGDYHIVLRDHLAYRYEVLSVLGKGSFGQVLKCLDHKSGLTVAVKLIRNKKRFHSQAMVEINILKQLVQWDKDDVYHNVRMMDHFSFRNHLCLVFECLSINLYDFIKSNHFQGFSMGLIKRFTVQILRSLSLLHKHKLIHCDLKPENILLKSPNKSAIKVIDFGSSCLENEKVYTYIQSRFYRSPEVILGMNYGMAIDMWSVGCILAELYSGYPLFPGENEQEQLACIMEIMDVPAMALIEKSARRKLFFDAIGQPRIVANAKGKKRYPRTKTLEQVLQQKRTSSTGSSETFALFVDFLHQCFQWDPAHRITPDQAFQHPWIRHSSAISSPSSKKHSSPPL